MSDISTPQKDSQGESQNQTPTFVKYLKWLGVRITEELCLVAIGCRAPAYARSATAACYVLATQSLVPLRAAEETSDPMLAEGLYLLPNEIHPDVAARDHQRAVWVGGSEQPKDEEVVRRRVVIVDCDPRRLKKISSNQSELDLSREMAEAIHGRLVGLLGSAESLALACSGNGYHVLLALDISTESDGRAMTDPARPLVERYLAALSVLHDTDRVQVDRSVVEARRIFPAYGTLKCKGANTAERPHRRTTFEPAVARPPRLDLEAFNSLVIQLEELLTPEQLAGVRAPKRGQPQLSPAPKAKGEGRLEQCAAVPLRTVMERLGLDTEHPVCPSCGHTTSKGDTSVALLPTSKDGSNEILKCLHGTCGAATYGSVSIVSKMVAGVETLKNDKEAVKKVLSWFEGEGLISPAKKKKPNLRLVSPEKLEEMGYFFDGEEGVSENSSVPSPAPQTKKRNLTDIGNAERLVDRHGHEIRYCVQWNKWLVWDGARWNKDDGGVEIKKKAMKTARAIYAEAAEEEDTSARIALDRHARDTERSRSITAMTDLAKALVPISTSDLDTNPWLLNCPNGTVDLRTGMLKKHDPKDYITKVTSVDFDPHADRSLVDRALERSHPDAEVRSYLWRLWGYSCAGVVEEHVFPIHWGAGRNGKGLFLNAIKRMLGGYGCQVPTELMVESRGDQHPAVRATLFGVRFALASETEEGARLKIAQIKTLCGGDEISARGMRENFFDFTPTHQLHLMTNPKPVITGPSEDPIWERIHLIPWGVVIPKDQRDKTLPGRLAASKGLLRALVEGCVDYVTRGGLDVPEAVLAATAEYRQESDVLGEFVEDCLIISEEESDYITSGRLYDLYVSWCEQSGRRARAKNRLTQDLDKAGIGTSGRSPDGSTRIRRGLRAKTVDISELQDEEELLSEEDQLDITELMAGPPSPEPLSPCLARLQQEGFGVSRAELDRVRGMMRPGILPSQTVDPEDHRLWQIEADLLNELRRTGK